MATRLSQIWFHTGVSKAAGCHARTEGPAEGPQGRFYGLTSPTPYPQVDFFKLVRKRPFLARGVGRGQKARPDSGSAEAGVRKPGRAAAARRLGSKQKTYTYMVGNPLEHIYIFYTNKLHTTYNTPTPPPPPICRLYPCYSHGLPGPPGELFLKSI